MTRTRRLGEDAASQHPALAQRRKGTRPRPGPSTLDQRLLRRPRAVLHDHGPESSVSILSKVNHQPESRMREIRTSGSEGGGVQLNGLSLPLSNSRKQSVL